MNDVLIAEISGKRPGDSKIRKTERFQTLHDKVIISNNSEGYITDWPIVNVPDDFRQWYIANHKNSENAWYAPMNRTYAIKYAREHGYKYLVQLDDNIEKLEISYYENKKKENCKRRFRKVSSTEMMDDFIRMQRVVIENTNAVMVGFQLNGTAVPDMTFLREGYVYSFFMLDLQNCPDVFQGDFEDDIEYRLKCAQSGKPVIQIQPLKYGKTGQSHSKDLSGCRAEYLKAGLKRGEHMNRLYGDLYTCKMSKHRHFTSAKDDDEPINFKHLLKRFKVGVVVKDMDAIKACFKEILQKYSEPKPDKCIIKVKQTKKCR